VASGVLSKLLELLTAVRPRHCLQAAAVGPALDLSGSSFNRHAVLKVRPLSVNAARLVCRVWHCRPHDLTRPTEELHTASMMSPILGSARTSLALITFAVLDPGWLHYRRSFGWYSFFCTAGRVHTCMQCWNWPKKTGGISCRNVWNFAQGLKFKADFHSKMSVCRHELGVQPPQPPQFQARMYAGDTQIYGFCRPGATDSLQGCVADCVAAVGDWMRSNRLRWTHLRLKCYGVCQFIWPAAGWLSSASQTCAWSRVLYIDNVDARHPDVFKVLFFIWCEVHGGQCRLSWCCCSQGLTMVYNCLHGKAPSYLTDCCTPISDVASRRHLRSASRHLLVPRHNLSTYGGRVFFCRRSGCLKHVWATNCVNCC